ncbi:MAG: ABC transporter substrate-binding protein [Desulfosporosinus sp.]|nr:ABC transporter substrate-binding protein [Desulfosporosinus sp.]
MRITRSYWLGLGSGLILSAMLTLVISPQQGQAGTSLKLSFVSPFKQQATTLSSVSAQPIVSTQLPITQSSTQIEQDFIIPNGASLGQIADLLLAQGFIKNTESFLVAVHQMAVESQLRSGTFRLSRGFTTQEVIERLAKK